MPYSDAEIRLRRTLTQTCDIARQVADVGTDEDLILGAAAVVATDQPCLVQALRVSADMLAAGPMQRDIRQLFMLADADLQQHDLLKDEDGTLWVVTDVPQVFGVAHHVEVTVERKAVQEGWPSA